MALWRSFLAVVVVSASAAACGSASAVAVEHAARDFGCPARSVRAQELESDRYKVAGCGDSAIYECHVDQGCWREGYQAGAAKERAARELDCPASAINVRWVQEETFRVDGCGQSRVYSCDDGSCVPEGSQKRDLTVIVVH
ncbi:MAG: hypothetical protein IPI67_14240 [Myxococcales bacterium]|nr:hypothetical protein [Myxococcales bacterium]